MWQGPLEKIEEYKYKIPKNYKSGMQVDGIIYADEKLLESIKKDKAPEQVANVATLPGIVKASLAMPDIHWGYGFCIGGVAATDIKSGGVISPGGVGFDINCLSPDTYILTELGYRIKIKDFKDIINREELACMDFNENKRHSTKILAFLKQKPANKLYKIKVSSGKEIIATEDHPFYTRDGMKEVKKLITQEEVALYPFEGVEYQKPSSEIIINKKSIEEFLKYYGKNNSGNALKQILNHLERKKMLPLRYDSFQLPFLIKLMGYCFGDGTMYFTNSRGKGVIFFYGEKEDLVDIQKDLEIIGFKAKIYSRRRHHKINTIYTICEFDREEFILKVTSSALVTILGALGVPLGNKCRNAYFFPQWLLKAPLWQKRLFLASLFGAELSSPKTITGHGYNFYFPVLSMNKIKKYIKDGENFLRTISLLLSEFGVTTTKIIRDKSYISKDGLISYRLRLLIGGGVKNLILLYAKIGFEYNRKKSFLGNCAVQYLKKKQSLIQEKVEIARQAKILYQKQKSPPTVILHNFSSSLVNKRFIERSIYEGRKTLPRVGESFVCFEEFVKKTTEGLGQSGMVWDTIKNIEEIKGFNNFVYDFSVSHCHHNFIANNFVVSNCGVRLVRTDLTFPQVKDKISKIVNTLYNNIPSGVGSKGKVKLSKNEEKKVSLKGAKWAVENGFGIEEDIVFCEEQGAIEGAEPRCVSQRAYERGAQQLGTLGSGNHFLEVQVIEEVFDEEIASFLGLYKNSIVVMIHTGSRGFGYQICDDYIRVMLKAQEKYGISLPDRQLACAPFYSSEGENYFCAMKAAANYAWCNRQIIMHLVRKSFGEVFSSDWKTLGMFLIYDVAHNIAKVEKYTWEGEEKVLCVHRKGATRAFGPNNVNLPQKYLPIGQPVIIPGDMGRASYLLTGTKRAEEETFGTTCHGAGRLKSRHQALKTVNFNSLIAELEKKGIYVRATGKRTILEEAPSAYKDVNEVVDVVERAGISKKICKMKPLCVVKG